MQHSIDLETLQAKILQHGHRQVLAYVFRDGDDALCVVLQLWVNATDEQLRFVVTFGADDAAKRFLNDLDEVMLARVLDNFGAPGIIADLESDRG